MKTHFCDTCKWFNYPDHEKGDFKAECRKGMKLRFYYPKTNNYMDSDYGWKRKCEDFKVSKRVVIIKEGWR
jgi:hypothetical protein